MGGVKREIDSQNIGSPRDPRRPADPRIDRLGGWFW